MRVALTPLQQHLDSFTPSLLEHERLARDAISYANRGQWFVGLEVGIGTASVATVVETMQLGEFLADQTDPWAPI